MKAATLLLCAAVLLPACARHGTQPVPPPADFVAVTLGAAAEKAHGDLALLAKLRGEGIRPILPPPDPALALPVSVSWTGPAADVLKEICLKVGYRFHETGWPGAGDLVVIVQGNDRPAHALIEDVAWQVQPGAAVRVDVINRTISLVRSGLAAGEVRS